MEKKIFEYCKYYKKDEKCKCHDCAFRGEYGVEYDTR